ncbi:ribbon-helix-helix domain-containing protein [Rahnella contaminans]|uniref:ribbon-helix-helix domain-containing protein n=1 Tax=Rahnella contaminans TaxID=2703882 RepID=UPI0023DAD7C0|nr:ribbon-helix-helix domain-containing protein [Rahnella contaminans]MDF1897217.1 ribbon-helix-helix domain-containing protein [Rahnella contaminans]
MAITKPPKKTNEANAKLKLDAFIEGAPDGQSAKKKGVIKGKKQQITLTITPEILDQLDQKAGDLGLSRAALINIGIRHVLNEGAMIGGKKD